MTSRRKPRARDAKPDGTPPPKPPPPPPDDDGRERVADLFQSGDTLRKRAVAWLLPGRLLAGSIAILEGRKSVGKSTLCAHLAAIVTAGAKFPGCRKSEPGSVLWLNAEESAESAVRPRLEAAGADLARVHFPATGSDGLPKRLSFPAHSRVLRDAIAHFGLRLVIVDPMSSYLGAETDLNHEGSVRAVLDPLNSIAMASGCVILMVRHLRKSRDGGRGDAGLGSVAISAVARSVLVIDQPDLRLDRRVLRVVSCNESPRTLAVEYNLDFSAGVPTLAGLREIPLSEDDPDGDLAEHGERDQRNDARLLLRRLLADGPTKAEVVFEEARRAGIGERTLRSIKAELGIVSIRKGQSDPPHWEWGPPREGWSDNPK